MFKNSQLEKYWVWNVLVCAKMFINIQTTFLHVFFLLPISSFQTATFKPPKMLFLTTYFNFKRWPFGNHLDAIKAKHLERKLG